MKTKRTSFHFLDYSFSQPHGLSSQTRETRKLTVRVDNRVEFKVYLFFLPNFLETMKLS